MSKNMKQRTPNPNLWSIKYALDGVTAGDRLWILAANPATASTKAKRFLRAKGERVIRIEQVKWEGTIDAF